MARRYYNLPRLSTALAAFEASARHMSFKAAAEELNVTPGAVSRQIRALEQDAGAALFERLHRRVALTPAGEELFAVLSQSFARTAEVFGRIKSLSERPTVTVGATTAFASMWLMPRLGAFWREHQDITINHQISDAAEDLRHPSIDLRIRYGDGDWRGEDSLRLFGDVIYPVCGPGFAARHKNISPEQIAELPLLQLHGVAAEWIDWDDWFAAAGLSGSGATLRKFNNYMIELQAARDDQGVALGWHSQVGPLIASGDLVRLTSAEIEAPGAFYVTWAAGRALSSSASALRDWLVSAASDQ